MNDDNNNTNDDDVSAPLELSPAQQLETVWERILQHNKSTVCTTANADKVWPPYKVIMDDISNADYTQVLQCPHDIMTKSRKEKMNKKMKKNDDDVMTKAFCAHGAVVCAKIEMFSGKEGFDNDNDNDNNNEDTQTHYTGLLRPGQSVENCIIRLSSAMKPPAAESNMFGKYLLKATGGKLKHAKLFPMVAIKAFRAEGVRSGNLLFAGPKIGQASNDFFEHCLCSQMTERVPSLLQPFIRKFYDYSDHPLSLGISDFCSFDQNGNGNYEVEFPYVVILKPVYKSKNTNNESNNDKEVEIEEEEKLDSNFDTFLDDLLTIPSGSVLFDIYACPDPSSALDPSMIQRIGRVTSTSEIVSSHPDDGLFFRHQKKEEDFDLRPHWREEVKAACVTKCGKAKGTVGKLVGSTFLESNINEQKFIDFE